MKMLSSPAGFKYFLVLSLPAALFLTAFKPEQQTRGTPLWVWLLVALLAILIVWYYFRTQSQESPQERLQTIPPPTPAKPDDLILIEGIGPKIAGILQAAGITTFHQLATTDVARLRGILEQSGIRLADPRSWAEQARLAAAGDMVGLKALQDRLKAGRTV